MPELPEVETTVRGIQPYLQGQQLARVVVRERRLRWPIPACLEKKASGQVVEFVERRGKYILIGLTKGGLLIHLGMSGSMRVLPERALPETHDHFDLETKDGKIIRYRDPRKFGCLLWHPQNIHDHVRLSKLGVEPLTEDFDSEVLVAAAKNRKIPVKTLIMNGEIVVGVGNIYASESLFDAGIHPHRGSHRIAKYRYDKLTQSIKKILATAIEQGGTTLKDFVNVDGKAGYFEQKLYVYGREGEPCRICKVPIKKVVTAQRATYYCPQCQT